MAKYNSYEKDRDYQAMINEAVANRDFTSAAQYEQQRNAKIAGEGITDYQQTHNWEQFLPVSQSSQMSDDYTRFSQQATQWDNQINALMERLNKRQPFSYDPETDPAYQAYKEQYTYGGQQAMKDTLAEVSARTGGLASSYAEQAAQGTYNDYMKRLSGVIPELRELAYNMYLNDRNDDYSLVGVLQNQQQQALQNATNERNWQYQVQGDERDLARKEIDAYLASGNPVSGLPQNLIAQSGYSNAYLSAMEGMYAPKVTGGYGAPPAAGDDSDGAGGDGSGRKSFWESAKELAEKTTANSASKPKTLTASQAIIEASSVGDSVNDRVMAIQSMYEAGQITASVRDNLIAAVRNPGK